MGLDIPIKSDSTMLDLVRAAYPKIIKNGKDMTNIAQTYQNYVVSDWFKGDRKKTSDGQYITWPIIGSKLNNVRHVKLYDEDTVANADVMLQGHAQWTHMSWAVAWDRRELDMVSSNPQKLFDLLMVRRAATQMAAMDQLEADLWGAPSSDAEVQTVPQGIPYWVQRYVSSSTGAFLGGDPSGITGGAGGIAVASNAGWYNWGSAYTAVSTADLVKNMRRAVEKLNFAKPAIVADDVPDEGRFEPTIYCGTEVLLSLEDVVAGQNESLGFTLDPTRGKATFYGVPITKAAALDASAWSAIAPVYLIDKASFKLYVLKNNDFRDTPPEPIANAHNVIAAHVDVSFQFVCTNRRRNGVISLT